MKSKRSTVIFYVALGLVLLPLPVFFGLQLILEEMLNLPWYKLYTIIIDIGVQLHILGAIILLVIGVYKAAQGKPAYIIGAVAVIGGIIWVIYSVISSL